MFGDGDDDGEVAESTNTNRFSVSGADKVMRYVAFVIL